jgi:hypothetical protein
LPGIPARRCKGKEVKKKGSTKAAYYYRADIPSHINPDSPHCFFSGSFTSGMVYVVVMTKSSNK